MTCIVVSPSGVITSSTLPINRIMRLHTIDILQHGKRYILFYDKSHDYNTLISDMLNDDIFGPVIIVKKEGERYISPTESEIETLLSKSIQRRNECILL